MTLQNLKSKDCKTFESEARKSPELVQVSFDDLPENNSQPEWKSIFRSSETIRDKEC